MKNNWIKRILSLAMVLLLTVPMFVFAEEAQPKPTVQPYGTINLNVGNKIYTVLNGKVISSVKSSKSKVASIDNSGMISALSEGKTKITIKYTNKTKSVFYVQVFDPNKPSNVYFAQGASVNIYAGQSIRLTPRLTPTNASTTYTWKSSKKKIAMVDANGTVSGLKPGSAKITVTTANKLKATITVNVLGNKVDNINPMPSSSLIAALRGHWTVVLKSVEILDNGKVAVEFYVINGINTSKCIQNLYVDLWVNNTPLVRGTIKKVSFKSSGGSCKVLKVTFPKTALITNISLPTLSSRVWTFKGLDGQLLTRR